MGELVDGLDLEIDWLKKQRRKSTYTLTSGLLVCCHSSSTRCLRNTRVNSNEESNVGVYLFKNDSNINLSQETLLICTIGGSKYNGQVEYCDEKSIELSIVGYSEHEITSVVVEINSWNLLEVLKSKASNVRVSKTVELLQKAHYKPLKETGSFELGQERAIEKALNERITLIWGPPGTGKTYTLANIALNAARDKKRVLIISQSNMAVDSAILQIAKIQESRGIKEKSRMYLSSW